VPNNLNSLKPLPGLIYLILVSIVSQYLSDLVTVGGKHPLEASVIAIIIGVLLKNTGFVSNTFHSGISYSEKVLVLGIVLLGASLDFNNVISQGPGILMVVLATMIIGFFLISFIGRIFSLSENLSLLLAIGTTICGTSAIAITAPILRSKQEETSYAIGTVAFCGLLAILVYPYLGRALAVSDLQFGVFAGTAIHSTPQVVGAGFMFSDIAGQTATAVKLVRNCFMAPLAFIIAFWIKKKNADNKLFKPIDIKKAFPWFLFGYFIMAVLGSKGYFSIEWLEHFSTYAKFFILMGMAGIGLSTDLSSFKNIGLKPLILGLIGTIILGAVSAVMISLVVR